MGIAELVKDVFGSAFHLTRGYIPGHDGLDIGAPLGTPIRAAADGVVEYARDARLDTNCGAAWACGGGLTVNVNIGGNMATQYAHMSRMAVSKGQSVKKGQIIGYVGKTGGKDSKGNTNIPGAEFVSGPHLHFGLWDKKAGKMINPTSLLAGVGTMPKTPVGGPNQQALLAAWGGIVKFPVGHIITTADVDKMMDALKAANMFAGDGVSPVAGFASEQQTRTILLTAVGKAWDKPLQEDLQKRFMAAASEATALGGIGTAIGDFGGVITKIAAYAAGILLLLLGFYLYSKGGVSGPAV